jgi:hypothetical protein
MGPARARHSERKVRAVPHEGLHPFNHQPTGSNRCPFGIEWRQPARDLVGVDELVDTELTGTTAGAAVVFPAPLGPPMMTISFNGYLIPCWSCTPASIGYVGHLVNNPR